MRIQKRQGFPNLSAWGLSKHGDQLLIDGVLASDLLADFGSPLLAVNESQLIHDIDSLKEAFSLAPKGSKIVYSYKTNSTPGIIQTIHRHGIGAEVISPYELWLAQQLSVAGDNIVYNGVSKTEKSLRDAIKIGVFSINADSLDEIELLKKLSVEMNKKVSIGLRIGINKESQFGLDLDGGEADAAIRLVLKYPDFFHLQSIQFHALANAQNSRLHRCYLDRLLNFALKMNKLYGINIPYLDIGGGFGIPTVKVMSRWQYAAYRLWKTLPQRPNSKEYQPTADYLSDLINTISYFCRTNGLPAPKLIIEPGRLIVSRGEILLTYINGLKIKSNGMQFALTDVGKHSIAYPCDYEYHEILHANKLTQTPEKLYDIVGRICTTADVVARNKCLPILEKNDILAILDAGAYFSSYSSNFAFQRPAVVKIYRGVAQVIRHEESFEHLIAMDELAEGENINGPT
jgi:diaminopimelate decarboxylase